jgi:RND superfamily putative drug exporter
VAEGSAVGFFGRLGRFLVRWPWAVIAVWVLVLAGLSTTVPPLAEMSQRNPVALLPANAPSIEATRQMSKAFNDSGAENILVVLLTDNNGLGKDDEAVYRRLVDRLRQDNTDVVMLQDFVTAPPLREALASKDGQAWILPVGLSGELGTPKAYNAYTRVSGIVEDTLKGSALSARMTGPAATVADLTDAGARDRLPIEAAIAVLLLIILAVIYRNPVTMLLPLLAIGVSLLTAQGLISAVSLYTGLPISNQAIVLLSAMIAGAGTDYAVFLISRYHDYVRRGEDSDIALRGALSSIGKVIAASAATVGVTFLGMGFAKLGLFSTTGLSLAMGIATAFLGAITLLPAVMVLAGRRGWIKPRPEMAAPFWRRVGIGVVRRPRAYLASSMAMLLALAACAGMVRYNYDDRKVLPAAAESSLGYAMLDRHFAVNQTIPQYLVIESPHDLRNARSLADLDQLAQRISQIPGIHAVRGVTRPTGETLPQARATYQAGQVGNQLADASGMIANRSSDLNRLASGANQLAGSLGDVQGQVNQAAGNVSSLIDALAYMQSIAGGEKTFEDLDKTAKLIDGLRMLGQILQVKFAGASYKLDWIDPVIVALDTSPTCIANPVCFAANAQFRRIQYLRDTGALDGLLNLSSQLMNAEPTQSVSSTVTGLTTSVQTVIKSLRAIGVYDAGTARRQLYTVQQGADKLASASRQVADGVDLMVRETKRVGPGLDAAASFLQAMAQDAATPAMAGFNIPPEVLGSDEFRKAITAFVSQDGHAVRYLIQTNLNPFSTEAMDQVNAILDAARGALPNTTLKDATVSVSGYPVTLRDTRDFYDRDLRLIIAITVVVVLLVLMLLLRAVVAPLYLVGSVILSYLSAVGLGVLIFQFGMHQQLHWSVPGLAFVVLVAVGADYNMLLASRLRDESATGLRLGVIRTVRSTGGVITAAGFIFAASMFGLLFSSITTIVQAGAVIGLGILLDTLIVRTVTVPSIATLVGRFSWWPNIPKPAPAEKPAKPTVFDSV